LNKKQRVQRGIYAIGAFFLVLFIIRALLPQEIDDVSPGIPCDRELLAEAKVLWIIPLFENESIANNQTWCAEIKALNKTLGLHGIYHHYKEFNTFRDPSYLEPGIHAFQECFNQTPKLFKAPQLALSKENKEWLEQTFKVKGPLNQITHKVYHCNDTGKFSNKLIKNY
jgi:hypothetical protein